MKNSSWAGSPGTAFLGSWSKPHMAVEFYLHWLTIFWNCCFPALGFWFVSTFDRGFGLHTISSYPLWWCNDWESGFMIWPLGELSGRTGSYPCSGERWLSIYLSSFLTCLLFFYLWTQIRTIFLPSLCNWEKKITVCEWNIFLLPEDNNTLK